VVALANGKPHYKALTSLQGELPADAHIEHILSHLGDYTALAQRSNEKKVSINADEFTVGDLDAAHRAIAADIASVIRWGYKVEKGVDPIVGTPDAPIVSVDHHRRFVRALCDTRQAGVADRRGAVQLFTTNYDTLLEDALALERYAYWDGFSGGAVAFRTHRFGQPIPDSGFRANVIKLHGSIDWYMSDEGHVYRVREFDLYPAKDGRVLIYPQATKYIATQRDPFASQFALFRDALTNAKENVLVVCGYSFGDEHINQEIELAMSAPENKTTLIAFCGEFGSLPATLNTWRNETWGKRIYVLSEKGLYAGTDGPLYPPEPGQEPHNWWTFGGMTQFLENGNGGSI